jgi:hypothetical protein
MSDWKIRVWYRYSVLPVSEKNSANMFNLKEFEKGEEQKVIEWVLLNQGQIQDDYYITDGSKKLRVSLEAK